MNLVLDAHMRNMPCPYKDVMDLRNKRQKMSGYAHRPGSATYDDDKAFIEKWKALYGQPPMDDFDVLACDAAHDVEEADECVLEDPVWEEETFMNVDW